MSSRTVLALFLLLDGCSFVDDFDRFSEAPRDASTDPAQTDTPPPFDVPERDATDTRDTTDTADTPPTDTPSEGPDDACTREGGCMMDPIVSVAAGNDHTCALRASGELLCWGANGSGQLGVGVFDGTYATPTSVIATGVRQVTAGNDHTCAIVDEGGVDRVKCWGTNGDGQLGIGASGRRATPVTVTGLPSPPRQVSAGEAHTCAVLTDGNLYCWGRNANGEIGDGAMDPSRDRFSPSLVAITDAVMVSAGTRFTCAVRSMTGSHVVACWGEGQSGTLGDGMTTAHNVWSPAVVAGLTNVEEVGAGGAHTCARVTAGSVFCWGADSDGRLGNGIKMGNRATPPTTPVGQFDELDVAPLHTCARRMGRVDCWGTNFNGMLGIGSTSTRDTPKAVVDLSNSTAVSTGLYHSCTVLASGGVMCWGEQADGRLGNGLTASADVSTPVSVVGLP